MTIFLKLPPNSGHLSITDKYLKTRRCPLFRVSLYHKCHKINLKQGRSYIDSPKWIKNKKATIKLINKKDNECFQYPVTEKI